MYIRVEVSPGAKTDSIKKIADNRYQVKVRAKAERNLANQRILVLLAAELGLPPKRLRIINGHQTPHKLISVLDV